MNMEADLKAEYDAPGYIQKQGIFSGEKCGSILKKIQIEASNPPLDWDKGGAVSSYLWYEIATQSQILDTVCQLIGKNVILWGTSLIRKMPSAIHPWHCDIENLSEQGVRW